MPEITVDSLLTDLVAGRLAPTVLSGLHNLPRSPLVSGSKVGRDQELIGSWGDAGGTLANTNPGASNKPHGTAKWTPSPSGTRLDFKPAASWDNVYMYTKLPFPAVVPTHLVDIRRVQMTASDLAGAQCLESDFQITVNGKVHNMGWQLNFAERLVRYFDYNHKKWIPVATPIPLPDMTKPVDFVAEFKIDDASTTHVALSLNGVRYVIGVSQPATVSNGGNKFTTAVQLDSMKSAVPLGVTVLDLQARYL